MPTINTQDLTGAALDWAVGTAQGQPLLERHRISTQHLGDRIGWGARWPA